MWDNISSLITFQPYRSKTFFSFFTLTPSLFVWNALFIGVSVVRVSVRVSDLPSHYSHTYPHHLAPPHNLTLPAGSIQLAGDSMDGRQIQWTGRKKAALYRQYSYGILLVQGCCTVGATMLHLWCQNALLFWHCQNFWYSYAGLLV